MNKKPGVADNKSYHDMYHFNDNFFDVKGKPSLNLDPDINSTIKQNDEFSNVEVEKDEVILQPDLSALFKAKGKTHKQGGIDVHLKPGAFVFSDDKSLALNKKENEMFEFKYGGKFTPGKCTPAHTLKKNIDVEHYNRLVANIQDPKKDDLAKKSSAMMLEKYIGTLGNIAYLQEKKKGFPQGLPEFSIGTAPVYNKEVKEEVDEQKQYAKYGGHIENPQFQTGGSLPNWFKLWTKSKTVAGRTTPTGQNSTYNPANGNPVYDDYSYWKSQNAGKDFQGPADYQKFVYNQVKAKDPNTVQSMWEKFGSTAMGMQKNADDCTIDGTCGFDDKLFGARTAALSGWRGPSFSNPNYGPPTDVYQPSPQEAPPQTPYPQVPGLEASAQGAKRADWEFTPWQKISQGYNALKYATAKRYMPMRSRFNFTPADPALLNEQQAVGTATAQANSQLSSLNTLNPIVRNAQASGAYGQLLDKIPELGLQVQDQNVGIKNQFRMYNNQGTNNVNAQNVQADQTYYQQSVVARQNFDNLKSYLGDQYMNNVLRDVETNQSLAYNLLTQNNPAYGYDWKTGNFTRNKKNILDVEGNGAQDELKQVMESINQIGDPYQKAQALTKLYGLKIFGPAIQQGGLKKGGYKNPYL